MVATDSILMIAHTAFAKENYPYEVRSSAMIYN